MSDEKKENDIQKVKTKKALLPIVNYFKKGSPKTVSDLNELLILVRGDSNQNVSEDDELILKKNLPNMDALVVLTSDALPEEASILSNYFRAKVGGLSDGVYQLIEPRVNSSQYDGPRGDWRRYLENHHIDIQTSTSLTDVLDHIIDYVNYVKGTGNNNQSQPREMTGFESFLTGLRNGDFGTFTEGQMGTKSGKDEDAMKIISEAIENSRKKCVIFTGAPGTGKTYCVEQYVDPKMKGFAKQYFVQFHSSYDYTDFVEGLRPVQQGGPMTFVRMDGIFKAFCREVVRLNAQTGDWAANFSEDKPLDGPENEYPDGLKSQCPPNDPEKWNMYYFVIDEINRADLGRVFGELMYCFEKRGKPVTTQYANLTTHDGNGNPISNDYFQKSFFIPRNVVIIGTMNDIDRSVETFDFALRRRFDWVEIEADKVMESSLKSMGVPDDIVTDILPRIMEVKAIRKEDGLNYVIEHKSGLGREFKIGPAYFKNIKTLMDQYTNKDPQKTRDEAIEDALTDIWEHNIEPILREYVRGRQDAKDFVEGKCKKALFPEVNKPSEKEPDPGATGQAQQPAGPANGTGSDH